MAEHKLVPPAEQWHEVTVLISKRQDDLLQQPYLPPPRQLVETVWEAWCGQPGVNVWWR
jgi:hypothetical protein